MTRCAAVSKSDRKRKLPAADAVVVALARVAERARHVAVHDAGQAVAVMADRLTEWHAAVAFLAQPDHTLERLNAAVTEAVGAFKRATVGGAALTHADVVQRCLVDVSNQRLALLQASIGGHARHRMLVMAQVRRFFGEMRTQSVQQAERDGKNVTKAVRKYNTLVAALNEPGVRPDDAAALPTVCACASRFVSLPVV